MATFSTITDVVLAARDRATLQVLLGTPSTPVPGFPYALVVLTKAGRQLFIDTGLMPRGRWQCLDFAAIWQAGMGLPVPPGHSANGFASPVPLPLTAIVCVPQGRSPAAPAGRECEGAVVIARYDLPGIRVTER